jgi:hypothetical protein
MNNDKIKEELKARRLLLVGQLQQIEGLLQWIEKEETSELTKLEKANKKEE